MWYEGEKGLKNNSVGPWSGVSMVVEAKWEPRHMLCANLRR